MTLTPAEIVRLLADCAEPDDSEYGDCVLCKAPLHSGPQSHEPDCPYRLAVEWVAENPS